MFAEVAVCVPRVILQHEASRGCLGRGRDDQPQPALPVCADDYGARS